MAICDNNNLQSKVLQPNYLKFSTLRQKEKKKPIPVGTSGAKIL